MKKTFLFVLFFCCFSMASIPMNNKSNEMDAIDLDGNLIKKDKLRSLVKPIQAFNSGRFIEVDFNAALGTVVISIYDETGGDVYQQSINTYDGQQIFIDITSFEAGEYTIEFVNSQGKYLLGDFEI